MLRFNEIIVIFWALVGLGLAGAPLKRLERFMGNLAVETSRTGYIVGPAARTKLMLSMLFIETSIV